MRKQVDFDIRVFDLTAIGGEGGMTHQQMSDYVRTNYLNNGWEVLGVQNTQVSANHAFFAVYLVKYEDVTVEEPVKKSAK